MVPLTPLGPARITSPVVRFGVSRLIALELCAMPRNFTADSHAASQFCPCGESCCSVPVVVSTKGRPFLSLQRQLMRTTHHRTHATGLEFPSHIKFPIPRSVPPLSSTQRANGFHRHRNLISFRRPRMFSN